SPGYFWRVSNRDRGEEDVTGKKYIFISCLPSDKKLAEVLKNKLYENGYLCTATNIKKQGNDDQDDGEDGSHVTGGADGSDEEEEDDEWIEYVENCWV